MKTSLKLIFLATLVMALLIGCSKRQTLVDQFYGTSYELAKQSQIYNPQAGIGDGPPVGLEGSVGSKVVDRYEAGFAQEAAKTDTYSVVFDGMKQK
jgi:hypothetical protein